MSINTTRSSRLRARRQDRAEYRCPAARARRSDSLDDSRSPSRARGHGYRARERDRSTKEHGCPSRGGAGRRGHVESRAYAAGACHRGALLRTNGAPLHGRRGLQARRRQRSRFTPTTCPLPRPNRCRRTRRTRCAASFVTRVSRASAQGSSGARWRCCCASSAPCRAKVTRSTASPSVSTRRSIPRCRNGKPMTRTPLDRRDFSRP